MVLFKKGAKAGVHTVAKEGVQQVLHINYEGSVEIPSIENSVLCMGQTVEKLAQSPDVSRIVYHQRKKYEYGFNQTSILIEIAKVYNYFTKQRNFLSQAALGDYGGGAEGAYRLKNLQYIILSLLKSDPVGAFVESKRLLREQRIMGDDNSRYFEVLTQIYTFLSKTKLIVLAKDYISGYQIGDREVYRTIFRSAVTPDFMYTRLMATPPLDADELDAYSIGKNCDVQIFKMKDNVKQLYHVIPPEFRIDEDKYELLETARKVLSEHQPKAEEYNDIERMRQTFFNIGRDLIMELANHKGIALDLKELDELAHILVRYTIGFGFIETLLQDEKVQDIAINSPAGDTPIFLVHGDYDECVTNIIPAKEDVESWTSKLRLISGRPLDEANPVLDTELIIPGARARVAVITKPLNPYGYGFSIRRHRDKPWTIPLFVKNGMLSDLAAGTLSFLIDGAASLLVAGTRGSGKCVSGDTPIYLADGSQVEIGTLIKNKFKNRKRITENDWEYLEGDGTEILSMDIINFKITKATVDRFWRHRAPNVLIKFETESGRELTCTPEHPLFIYQNNLVMKKRADKLLIGDKLAYPTSLDIGAEISFDIVTNVDYLLNHKEKYVYDLTVLINHNFVAGKIPLIAHNTSLLGSVLVEIMRKYRVLTVEDSVTGDSELLVKRNNKIEKTTIGELIDSAVGKYGSWYNLSGHEILGNDEDIEILSMNKENKIIWAKPLKLVRHKVDKKIYSIKTRTGRVIKVTQDHSLFALDDNANISEIKPIDLKIGSHIATVRRIPLAEKPQLSINLLDYINRMNCGFLIGDYIKTFIKENYYEIKQLAKEHRITRSGVPRWLRNGILPIKILKDLNALDYKFKQKGNIYFKVSHNSEPLPISINLDSDFLTLIGIWLADGCYDSKSVIFSTFDREDREIVTKAANKFNLNVKVHSDGGSFMLNSTTLKFIFKKILELRGNAYTKKIPNWVFSLSKEQIGYVLKGIFSGDGCVADKEIVIPLASMQLLRDIQTLLLGFDIRLRIGKMRKDKTFNASISSYNDWVNFKNYIGILQHYKQDKLDLLCSKISTHDTTDIIPLSFLLKNRIRQTITNNKIFNSNDYITRSNNIGRRKLSSLVSQVQVEDVLFGNLLKLANSDIYWDEIKEINLLEDSDVYVYDLSVPEYENFVCNNVIVHNTLELPSDALRELGYNIQQMKVRSALAHGGSELSADEGIRTSLRMGDSALIVGEVRSLEALALFEAMRTGALANTVAGTIHGDSPYGVFDRVVNDLKVPKTSFKAMDIILVSNPIKSADGLHRMRRVMSFSEVRKTWEDDPLREGGFVDLFKYDAQKDTLIPTSDLINGNSEIIKRIGGQIKDWAGSWDAIWDNILLRAKIKKTMVEYSHNLALNDILEAKSVILMNDSFHKISGNVKAEVGYLDPKRIFFNWEEEFKSYIKRTYGKI